MRRATPLFLTVMGLVGLLAGARAVAQQPIPPYDPGYAPQAAPGSLTPATPMPSSAMPNAYPVAPPALAPTPPTTAAGKLGLTDSGLWENPDGCGCAICGGGAAVNPPDWYTEQDLRILTRTTRRNFGLGFRFASEFPNGFGAQEIDIASVSPGISPVWGMTIGHYFARDSQNRDHFVEFSFWGLNAWSQQISAHGGRTNELNRQTGFVEQFGNLYSPFSVTQQRGITEPVNELILPNQFVNGFDRVDFQSVSYRSSTNNFELNGRFSPRGRDDRLVLNPNGRWRRECSPGRYISYLYGVRYFQLNESLRYHGQGTTDLIDPASGQIIDSTFNTGEYDVTTHNNMLGLQFGAELEFRHCRWQWGITGKVGPYVNFCDQESDISAGPQVAPTFVRNLARSARVGSLIAETGFNLTYKFRPNLVGRASYDFNFVTGIAAAPAQLQFVENPSSRINAGGFTLIHGVTLGLEWLW